MSAGLRWLGVALGLGYAVSAGAAEFGLAELMRLLGQVPSAEAHFTETRRIALLQSPLVVKGRLAYVRPDRPCVPQVTAVEVDELACRPGSVPVHLSAHDRRPSIYGCRHRQPPAVYPRTRAGRPRSSAQDGCLAASALLLTLLQVGFT